MLSLAVFLPILCGLFLLPVRFSSRAARSVAVELITLATSALVAWALWCRPAGETVFELMPGLPIAFRLDGLAFVFAGLVAFLWPLATLYGFEYMAHEGGEDHFFALYTVTYGVTLGIALAANIVTMYLFFELLTLVTLPLVMHGTSEPAIRAGRMYFLYSFFGAALGFIGMMLVVACGGGGTFLPGGALDAAFAAEHPWMLRLGYLCCALGFGVKAAIFPFHAWLPEAAVAPTPVTALLHAVAVVKAGAFAVMRATYFAFGAGNLSGTWTQAALILLASITIVYASLTAVREHHFKRRLAWSTVSNLSYVLLACALMTEEGLTASLAHLLFHALIKITLFYCAGAILVQTGKTQVEELRGLYAAMPVTCTVYTVAALALAGTPLLPGFVSKWLIGTAALDSGNPFALIGLAALLVSAVLTAIYILGPVFLMLFRREEGEAERLDPGWRMKLPLLVLTAAIVACGLFSDGVVALLAGIAAAAL